MRSKIKVLKDAGLASTSIGLESGDDYVRNEIFNRGISEKQLIDTANLFHEYNIPFGTFNILGVPFSRFESNYKTLLLNLKMKPDWASTTLYQPLPRTILGDRVIQKGLFRGFEERNNKNRSNILQKSFAGNKKKIVSKSQLTLRRKYQVENLKNLFSILIEFPVLVPVAKYLIRLPIGRIYFIIDQIFRGYIGMKKFFTHKRSLKETLTMIYWYIRTGFET